MVRHRTGGTWVTHRTALPSPEGIHAFGMDAFDGFHERVGDIAGGHTGEAGEELPYLSRDSVSTAGLAALILMPRGSSTAAAVTNASPRPRIPHTLPCDIS